MYLLARIDKWIRAIALIMAWLGGVALIGLIFVTVISVSGRALISLGFTSIRGDFELIEAGTAFAVFAFLPWCQYQRGHARVELLTPVFPPATNRFLDVVADIVMLLAMGLITRQLALGTLDKLSFQETSFILRFPIWWAYAAALAGSAVAVVVAIFCLARSLAALFGQSIPALSPHEVDTDGSGGWH